MVAAAVRRRGMAMVRRRDQRLLLSKGGAAGAGPASDRSSQISFQMDREGETVTNNQDAYTPEVLVAEVPSSSVDSAPPHTRSMGSLSVYAGWAGSRVSSWKSACAPCTARPLRRRSSPKERTARR
jgi:hypothetical protein